MLQESYNVALYRKALKEYVPCVTKTGVRPFMRIQNEKSNKKYTFKQCRTFMKNHGKQILKC